MEVNKIEIIPYLPFNGNCEEAINTYIKAFSGTIHYMSRWSESTYDVGPEQSNKILHVEFTLGNVCMAAGDNVDYIEAAADIRLILHMDSEKEASRAIALLSEGGNILVPLHKSRKSDGGCEAILTDRFGVMWIITCGWQLKSIKKLGYKEIEACLKTHI